jgi:hypothetical protein
MIIKNKEGGIKKKYAKKETWVLSSFYKEEKRILDVNAYFLLERRGKDEKAPFYSIHTYFRFFCMGYYLQMGG